MSVALSDPFGARADPALPTLRRALDPDAVQGALAELFACRGEAVPELHAITVRRHKPGRRCLIAFEMATDAPDGDGDLVLLGKLRAKGVDTRTYRLQESMWRDGFGPASADRVFVPEPVGALPALGMWCQRQVPGSGGVTRLRGPGGAAHCARFAEAAFKLHRARLPTERRHSMRQELEILSTRLRLLAARRPGWSPRLERVLTACERLCWALPSPLESIIHRDYYPDQVLADGRDVYLLDLDLCSRGDPGVDVGNFVAHLIELALRVLGDPGSLEAQASAFVERYVQLAGEQVRQSIQTYTTLSLARHIQISTTFSDREAFAGQLLEICEARLSA